MAKTKDDSEKVHTFHDHEVIVPPNKLKKAVVPKRRTAADPDPVAQAEAALAELSHQFDAWMETECNRLDVARLKVRQVGFTDATLKELFHVAHDLRGQSETFGYPTVGPIADSLCRLIEHTPDPARIPLPLVDQHVDAMRAIVREQAGKGHVVADRLGQKLRHVTDDFLAFENRDRPDYLDGILSPPIAPAD